jgi:hypothetical protein
MKLWPRWSIRSSPDGTTDFLPIVIGCLMLLTSVPGFFGVLFFADANSGVLATGLLVWLATGIVLGAGFLIFGIRICSYPGSLAYRITHGRFFTR